jgi:hypothetical protein
LTASAMRVSLKRLSASSFGSSGIIVRLPYD